VACCGRGSRQMGRRPGMSEWPWTYGIASPSRPGDEAGEPAAS